MTEAKRHGDARTINGRNYTLMIRHDSGRLPWVAWVAVLDDGDSLMVGSGYESRTRAGAIALAQRELDERAADAIIAAVEVKGGGGDDPFADMDERIDAVGAEKDAERAARQAPAADDPFDGLHGEAPPMNGAETERTARTATEAALAAVPEARKAEWRANWERQKAARNADAERRWAEYLAGLDGGGDDTPPDDEALADFRGYEDPGQPEPFDPRPGEALLAAAEEAMRRWGAESIEDALYRYDCALLLEPTAEERKMRRGDELYTLRYDRTPAEGAAARRRNR